MITTTTQCWAFRVDRKILGLLNAELVDHQRLRQGWGWNVAQDLRKMTMDSGAGRNRRMFKQVMKGDLILIPHLPEYGQITIAEATEDWKTGYTFDVFGNTGDHGHIFPTKHRLHFNRNNENVPAALRDTFRNPGRFWNITRLRPQIETVLSIDPHMLGSTSSVVDRWQRQIERIVRESTLQERLFEKAKEGISKSNWEYLLVDGLQKLNPGWKLTREGGRAEAHHGTDILATIPNLFGDGKYGVAIQVKDYKGIVTNDSPINQISKAKVYWEEKYEIKIIEMVVVLIGSEKELNSRLENAAETAGVQLVWLPDVESLIFRSACKFMSDPDRQISSDASSIEEGEPEPKSE